MKPQLTPPSIDGAFRSTATHDPIRAISLLGTGTPEAPSSPLRVRLLGLNAGAQFSNNSSAAIAAYLADHRLDGYIRAIAARDDHDPERMKPSPYRVREAVSLLDAEHAECVLVGDCTTDVLAGRLAGVAVIGYADKPGKTQALAGVQTAVTTDLAEITTALHTTA